MNLSLGLYPVYDKNDYNIKESTLITGRTNLSLEAEYFIMPELSIAILSSGDYLFTNSRIKDSNDNKYNYQSFLYSNTVKVHIFPIDDLRITPFFTFSGIKFINENNVPTTDDGLELPRDTRIDLDPNILLSDGPSNLETSYSLSPSIELLYSMMDDTFNIALEYRYKNVEYSDRNAQEFFGKN